ncbi:MAG: transporter substrate-binding domain-containing protein [Lachnospiraceae bacterium]|nr:transporter substrate-binding domain-containing protein [Lachnospiraceae bacterium]
MKRNKISRLSRRLAALTLSLLFVLSGCSSADSSEEASTTAAASSADTAAVTETADDTEAASDTETVVLRCGVKQAHTPYSYVDESGELVGLEEDVVTEAFNRIEGYEVEFVQFDASPSLFSALQTGSIDFASGQYAKSSERREIYKFAEQFYAVSPYYLVSREEDSFQTLEDIAGETLEFASTAYEKEVIEAFNAANPDLEDIVIVDTSGDTTNADQLQQLSIGQRNVLLLFKSSYDTLQAELNLDNLVLSDEPALVEDVYQVFNSSVDDAVIELFNDALVSMYEDGTLSEITVKWCGEDTISLYGDQISPIE